MKIYYQGIKGSYTDEACIYITPHITNTIHEIVCVEEFQNVWENISSESIGVLPFENSYAGHAGSVYQNIHNFVRYDHKIIGGLDMSINHCLLSHEKNIKNIKKVYSHPQSLAQCHQFLKKHNIEGISFQDNGAAAQYVGERTTEKHIGAIASKQAGKIYHLGIVQEAIQDQKGNTTRFFIIGTKYSSCEYTKKMGKVTILFETRDIPAVLYKCLGAFATNHVNLTKIESLPDLKDPFSYIFWLDFQGKLDEEHVKSALDELQFFTKSMTILGEY